MVEIPRLGQIAPGERAVREQERSAALLNMAAIRRGGAKVTSHPPYKFRIQVSEGRGAWRCTLVLVNLKSTGKATLSLGAKKGSAFPILMKIDE